MENNILLDSIQSVLAYARTKGIEGVEVTGKLEHGFSATARKGESETLSYHKDHSLTVTVYENKRCGSVTSSDLRPETLNTAVDAARRIASYAEVDPDSGLAEPELLGKNIPVLDIYFPWDITPQDAMQLAIECDNQGLAFDKRITNSDGTTVSTSQSSLAYANTNGFLGHYNSTEHSISSVLVAEEGTSMERDYYYATACDYHDLPSIKIIGEEAAHRSVSRLNSRVIKTQQAPVIYTAEVAREFMGHLLGAIRGRALYQRSSFLLDQLGQTIFPTWFNAQEKPHLARGLGSVPFDEEGLLTRDKSIIHNGVLENYTLDVYSGRKLKLPSTANAGGVHNLVIQPGEDSLKALIKKMDKGLLLTEVMGPGINLVTGDYSRGAAGFWVEHGEIQYPVSEITIAGNLKTMFQKIVAVGNDVDVRGNVRTPSILMDDVMIGGD